LSSYHFLF